MALVLCVDDDEAVAEMVGEVVSFCLHTPLIETNSMDAVTKHLLDSRVKAVLTDLMMPRMNGVELLEIWRERRPEVRRVIITAAPHEMEVRKAARDGLIQMVIAKPPNISDIKLALAWLG